MNTIGPNPTLVRLEIGATIQQKPGETREAYLHKARRYCSSKFESLRNDPDYKYSHSSFAVRDAMLCTEAKYCDIGTFGVEYTARGKNRRSPAIDYLNTGDSYGLTILRVNGMFRLGCWGNIVERGNYE